MVKALGSRDMAELQTKLMANDGLQKMGGERNGLTSEEAKKRLEVGEVERLRNRGKGSEERIYNHLHIHRVYI